MIDSRAFAVLLLLVGCGDRSNLRLEVVPGQSRSTAEQALKGTNYCRREPREQSKQSYVRCGVKGFELGESWVVLDYDERASVVRARRLEHFEDPEKATERWNALVGERNQELGAESGEARERLSQLGEGPMGAMVWKAWLSANRDQVIGLYLVRPADQKDPQVVEVIRWDRGEP